MLKRCGRKSLNIIQMIIDSGTPSQPDEVVALLRKAMGLKVDEPLRREAIRKFLDEQGVSPEDALTLGVYLYHEKLLDW